MIEKEISSWEKFCIPNSDLIIIRRMAKDDDEISAVVFGKEEDWKWMILSESRDVASGSAKSLQLGKFMVDLNLSDLINADLVENLFE